MLIRHERVLDWLVLYTEPELDESERHFEAAVAALDDTELRGVVSVIAYDGFPRLNHTQIEAISDAFLPHRYPAAVITAHPNTRALLKSLEWMGGNIRPFSREQLHEALDWLTVPAASHQRVFDAIAKLSARVRELDARA